MFLKMWTINNHCIFLLLSYSCAMPCHALGSRLLPREEEASAPTGWLIAKTCKHRDLMAQLRRHSFVMLRSTAHGERRWEKERQARIDVMMYVERTEKGKWTAPSLGDRAMVRDACCLILLPTIEILQETVIQISISREIGDRGSPSNIEHLTSTSTSTSLTPTRDQNDPCPPGLLFILLSYQIYPGTYHICHLAVSSYGEQHIPGD